MRRQRQASGAAVPIVRIDARAGAEAFGAAVDQQLLREHANAEVVLVQLTLPDESPEARGALDDASAATASTVRVRRSVEQRHPRLEAAMREFQAKCPELTDRSKRKKRECTNVC